MRFFVVLSAMVFLVGVSAEPNSGFEESEIECECGPMDDPEIYAGEVVVPSMDSTDPAWVPGYWFEDPSSLECGGRTACEAYKANATVGAVQGA